MAQEYQFAVNGLRCAGCANKLEKQLNALEAVVARVNFALGQVSLSLESERQLPGVWQQVEQLGYTMPQQAFQFDIQGWNCGGCANKTVRHLEQYPQLHQVTANVAANQLNVSAPQGLVKPAQIAGWIESLGYRTRLAAPGRQRSVQLQQQEREMQQSLRRQWRLVLLAILLTLPLVSTMVGMLSGALSGEMSSWHLPPWLEWLLATPVQFVVGARYYRGAWQSLKNRMANMDTLVALGTSAAYFYSLYLWWQGGQGAAGQLYFEASAVVITLVSLGKVLETRAKHSTTEAIRQLMALRPETARVIRNGQEQQLDVDDVLLGDRVKILPGEKIPVDGEVLSGDSDVNEALITGESIPQTKVAGSAVIAGSVNGNGVLEVETSAVGDDTSLSQIISLVERTQLDKAPLQALVDKIAAWFVPVVLIIAVLTFAGWWWWNGAFESALLAAVAVLVVACPCALGLATPAAIVTGTGMAARRGILIRDIDSLQRAAKLEQVVFDKTGTLTLGEPAIRRCQLITPAGDIGPWSESQWQGILRSLAALQSNSEHPLAKAIMRAAKPLALSLPAVTDFKAHSGGGVSGTIDGQTIVAGNRQFLASRGIAAAATLENHFDGPFSQVWVAIDGQLLAVIELDDPLRPTSRQAIAALRQQGIRSEILSGDNPALVAAVADELGVDGYRAGLLPADKLAEIKQRQRELPSVAMVGDGINDAPALTQADVGVAMGCGTQVAMASAGITLMRSDPALVVEAIDLSRATWRTIKQNLFWAFIFNTLGIPLAAFGYLSPALAGAAMAASSICVLSNALWLKRWRPSRSLSL